ncbi:MAG: hypothetical protein HZB79_03130 [Deltaproteobacteria bacterium]|nr:hypothetical protein [Deltaproteobacteria bacterium]
MDENKITKGIKKGLSPYKEYKGTFPTNYLINEYNQLFAEIRFINDKISSYIKVFLTILSSYIAYTILGLKLVLAHPESIVGLLYGGFGIFISIFVYFLLHMGQRQYSKSKNHKIRYWKSIQHLRKILCDVLPEIKHYLLLPVGDTDDTNKSRPNFSGGEKDSGIAWAFFNFLFFVVLFFYFYIFFELSRHSIWKTNNNAILTEILNNGITPYTQPYFYNAMLNSLVWILLLLVYPFSLPERAFWHYYKNVFLAQQISQSDSYPKFGDDKLKKIVKDKSKCNNILYDYSGAIVFVIVLISRFVGPPYSFSFANFWHFLNQYLIYFLSVLFIISIEVFRYHYKKKVLNGLFEEWLDVKKRGRVIKFDEYVAEIARKKYFR